MSEEFDLYAKDEDPRSEKTLSAILGNYDGELDPPASRVEAYLLAIKEMLEGGGGGGGSVTVDTELKPHSTNPVQNKAIYDAIAELAESATSEKTGLVKPDGTSTMVDENGNMSVKPSIVQAVQDTAEAALLLQSQVNNLEPRVSSTEQALTVNLLNPTFASQTKNGVTITRNADNTYTLNGTATQDTYVLVKKFTAMKSQTHRITGCPQGGAISTFYVVVQLPNGTESARDFGDGTTKELSAGESYNFIILAKSGTVCDNLTFKPMLTTNLSATYDDYVPYSGSSGNLNTDYTDLQGKINESNLDISDIKGYIGYTENDIYGVEVDFVNKRFTRLAAAVNKTPGADFDNVEPWKRRRCNLTDDGVVTAYYGDAAYTETGALEQAVEVDGSTYTIGTAVQVMVEQPKFYYKVVPVLTEKREGEKGVHLRKGRYYVSATKKAGFKVHPAFVRNGVEMDKIYLSAYEGSTYDVSASEYNTTDAQTVDFTASTGDLLASIAGAKPTSGLSQSGATRAGFRTISANRGTGWTQLTVQAVTATELLFIVECAAFNMQNVLGTGVINKTDDGSTNMAELTGATSTLGNASGSVTNGNGFNIVSYRGEENLYGNIWKWVDGINVYNYGEGSVWIADHAFTDNTKTGAYQDTGITIASGSNYVSAFAYNEDFDWLFIASEVSGSSALPVGDYFYQNKANEQYTAARLGGNFGDALPAGGFYWSMSVTSSFRARNIGGRLLYAPASAA